MLLLRPFLIKWHPMNCLPEVVVISPRVITKVFTVLAASLLLTTQCFAQNSLSEAKQERNRSTVSVIGGGISGTYIRFATDLANVLDDPESNDLRVLPIVGRGGGQNVLDVLFLKGVDMGITQQDHLTFFKQENPAVYGNVDRYVHYVTKLYNAEFHLVARKEFKTLDDLRGKTVNFWKPWSATDIGGRTVFKLMGIEADFINIDTQLALEKMKTGEVAATSLLAGAPVKGYKDLLSDQGLHFIGVDPSDPRYAKLLEVYLPASLKHEDYPGLIPQGETVPTVASGAVLAVYNWPQNTPQYRKLARFVRKFFDNFEKFRKEPRHPKWRDINLAAEVPGWTRFKPAEEWLATNTKAPESELKTAFNRFLTSFQQSSGVRNISDQQKDQLFEEFVRWYNTQQ